MLVLRTFSYFPACEVDNIENVSPNLHLMLELEDLPCLMTPNCDVYLLPRTDTLLLFTPSGFDGPTRLLDKTPFISY